MRSLRTAGALPPPCGRPRAWTPSPESRRAPTTGRPSGTRTPRAASCWRRALPMTGRASAGLQQPTPRVGPQRLSRSRRLHRRPGAPNSPAGWFQDNTAGGIVDGAPLDDGELTRAEDKLAAVRGPNTPASSSPTMIRVYAVSSLSAPPTVRCDLQSAPNSRSHGRAGPPTGRASPGARAAGSGPVRSPRVRATAALHPSG